MRILIVADAYPPEVGSASFLMRELADELSARGNSITVLTSWPQYKLDKESAARVFEEKMQEGEVTVLRIKTMALHNVNFIQRGFGWLSAPWYFWRGLKRHETHPFDAVIVYSPPLTLSLVGNWVKREGARYLLNVQDLFPQNAIDLGILTNPLIVAAFRRLERKAYRDADVVTAHSPSNRNVLAHEHPDIASKLVVLHNWVDIAPFEKSESLEDYRKTFGLEGKMIGVYGGVTGPAQGLDVILDVAGRVRDLTDLVFLIVGEGTEKARLERRSADEGLSNVVFKPFVSHERYPSLLRSADFGFLTLDAKMKTPVVPGKVLGYMAAGLPVLAIVNRESDIHPMVAEAQCGYAAVADDVDAAEALTRRLFSEREQFAAMGARGRTYARAEFAKQAIVERVLNLLAPPR